MRQALLLMVRMGHRAYDKTVQARGRSRSGRQGVQNTEERVVRLRRGEERPLLEGGRWAKTQREDRRAQCRSERTASGTEGQKPRAQ